MMHAKENISQRISPKLTIGMPVYNGASTISNALNSLLDQDYKNFIINISDNASTDSTEQICNKFSVQDSRVNYFRQKDNLGAIKNFKYLLDICETDYFMFAAADDLWAPSFAKKCIVFLDENEDYVQCQGMVLFSKKYVPSHLGTGTYEICKNPSNGVYKFLKNPSDNSRYYGIFRTEVLKKCFPSETFIAHDWAVSAWTLMYGKHKELNDALMIRDTSDITVYQKSVIKEYNSTINRLFPALPFSAYVLKNKITPLSVKSIKRLYHLNLFLHFALSPYKFEKLSTLYFQQNQSLSSALAALLLRKQIPSPICNVSSTLEIGVETQNDVTSSGIQKTSIDKNNLLKWTDGLAEFVIHRRVARNYKKLRIKLVSPPKVKLSQVEVLINSKPLGKYKLKPKEICSIKAPLSGINSENICITLKSKTYYSHKLSCTIGVGIKSIKLTN